jgi:hypothetical protein
MSGDRIRNAVLALVTGAALAAGQIWIADRIGIADLGADFTAGNERSEGAAVTLVGWFCAVAVILASRPGHRSAVAAANSRAGATASSKAGAAASSKAGATASSEAVAAAIGTAVAAAIGAATAALPVVATLGNDTLWTAALGTLLGLAAALLAVPAPALRIGVAVHAGVWWAFALIAAPAGRSAAYSGLVELLDVHSLRQWLFPILPSGRILSYHLPYLLPSILTMIVAGAVAVRIVRRRGGGRVAATLAGSAGMLLATGAYLINVRHLTMWNGEVFVLVLATTLLTVLVAFLTAQLSRAVPST